MRLEKSEACLEFQRMLGLTRDGGCEGGEAKDGGGDGSREHHVVWLEVVGVEMLMNVWKKRS
jgi:hypothetical protein